MLTLYLGMIEDHDCKEKFEELYFAYRQDMFAVAYHILNNRFDAEDAVHDAFMRIAKNVEKISEIKCPETRAFTVIITRNAAIDIYNRNKKNAEETLDIDDCSLISDENDLLKEYDYVQLIDEIKELPDICKDVLYLRFVSGYSVKNIAELLGISTDAVQKRIQRARKLLSERLEKEMGSAYV